MNPEKTSRQRKAYALILALAIGGLAVDRLILGGGGATGPETAKAETTSEAAPLATTKSRTTSNTNLTTRANTLAGRLDQMAKQEQFDLLQVDDGFRPAPDWMKQTQTKEPPATISASEAFRKKHKLLALVNNHNGGAAIINSHTVVLGGQIDGFTLIEVTKRSAVLVKEGERVELELPAPNANPTTKGD